MNSEEIKNRVIDYTRDYKNRVRQRSLILGTLVAAQAKLTEQAAELERLREQTQWKPIETAPKDGTEIMGFSDYGELIPKMCWKHHYWFNGKPATKKSWGRGCSEGPFPTPTHWMPPPEPPK